MSDRRLSRYDPQKWGDFMEMMESLQKRSTGTSVRPPPPPKEKGKGKKGKKKGKFFLDTVTDGVKTAKKYFDSIAELMLLLGVLRSKDMLRVGATLLDGTVARTKKELKDHIPFDWSKVKGGTQYPTIRLFIASTNITTTSNTLYNTTFSLTASKLLNFTDLAAIFDEYRVIGAEIRVFGYMDYNSATSVADTWRGIGVLDYGNSTALTTLDMGLAYDTHKMFTLAPRPETSSWEPATWTFVFEQLPDQEWIQTSTTNTVFGYWKPFIHGNQVDTTDTAGFITGWCDVQFRETI